MANLYITNDGRSLAATNAHFLVSPDDDAPPVDVYIKDGKPALPPKNGRRGPLQLLTQCPRPFDVSTPECFKQIIEEYSETIVPPQKGSSLVFTDLEFHNYISNELFENETASRLNQMGGVYLGVGPQQNYSYIAATRPKIAFIVDIRRENLLQHMIVKALMEMSSSRAEFLSYFLSREMPDVFQCKNDLSCTISKIEGSKMRSDLAVVEEDIINRIKRYIPVTDDDAEMVKVHLKQFRQCGLNVTFDEECEGVMNPRSVNSDFPSLKEIVFYGGPTKMSAGWLGTEDNFQYIKKMHMENKIIPLVADFAGKKTLRLLGETIKDLGLKVSLFYASNVEDYLDLIQQRQFLENIRALPADENSIFIKSMGSTDFVGPGETVIGDKTAGSPKTYLMSIMKIQYWLALPRP